MSKRETPAMSLFIPILLLLLPASVLAQAPLRLEFPRLAAKAAESVEVTLDGKMLQLASKFLSRDDPEEAAVRELVRDLKGIYVKSYTFDREGEFSAGDLDMVRDQLDSTWQRIVNVKSRKSDDVEIYFQMLNGTIQGMTIIATEPKELTIVNLVGPLDLDKLSALEGQLGIPDLGIEKAEGKKEPGK